ncbi:MAG: DNA translocase FtsK [Opitutales bacterium]|nr:DNA translocase FtsK [Opitutales bacterium]
MGKTSKQTSSPTASFRPRGARPRPLLGILALIFALISAFSLGVYSPAHNPRFNTDAPDQLLTGVWGMNGAYYAFLTLGVAAFAIPFFAVWLAYMFFLAHSHKLRLLKIASIAVILLSFTVFASMTQLEWRNGELPLFDANHLPHGLGGLVGKVVYEQYMATFLGFLGSLIIFGVLGLFSVIYLFQDNLFNDARLRLDAAAKRFAEKRAEWAKNREERDRFKKVEKTAKAKIDANAKKAERMKEEAARASAEEAAAKSGAADPKKRKSVFAAFSGLFRRKRKPAPQADQAGAAQPFDPIVEGPGDETAGKSAAPAHNKSATTSGAQRKRDASRPLVDAEDSVDAAEDTGSAIPAAAGNLALKKAATGEVGGSLKIIASEQTKKANVAQPAKRGNFVFPPLKLLSEPQPPPEEDTTEMHQQTADLLIRTLDEFGVKVTMGEVHAGPVITRYDVYPAAGVRVEKILSLDKNIALGLKALSVRILAPVPGKGCVGIEVPNRKPQSVFIRDILESEDWVNTKAEIPVALGKEVSGKPMIADLTKMPHLLIAGSTGSGKTVCINAIITSLLYHSSPDDIRFVMVDPKIVEMQVYNTLPHMLVPVVTDPKKVPNALKYLLNQMEQRYQIFAQVGVRNIAGYNAKMAKNRNDARDAEARAAEIDASLSPEERAAAAAAVEVPRDPDTETELPEKLPYIVCVVDELADLMMVAPADIETGIARLAQLARAAGIHLILATQRPSVNVITGVIKANLPSRIAFKVASKVDSRTILDTQGADHLIGKGDMLFLPPGSADLVRSQGAFVGDDEISGIVEYISEHNGEPVFDEQFQRTVEEGEDPSGEGGSEGEWDDELVPDAIEVIRSSRRASTSMLQRRLKIGYNRAARIMEILEDQGMVGPENGSSPREILVELD